MLLLWANCFGNKDKVIPALEKQIAAASADSCTDYRLRVRGNDPEISNLPNHSSNDKIMLVGTSGLRTLNVACQLGSSNPKIFLIDNSI